MDVFDPLLAQMTAWCGHVGVTSAGSLLCPHGSVLKEMIKRRLPVNDIPGAAKEVGRQLIKECIRSKELFKHHQPPAKSQRPLYGKACTGRIADVRRTDRRVKP